MSLESSAERLSAPFDWARRGWFGWLVRLDFAKNTLCDRDRRIATLASLNVVVAALGALYFPVLLFALGPVLFGVAHVAADVRYLVLRRTLAGWWQNAVWLGCLSLIGVRVLEEFAGFGYAAALELGFGSAFVALGAFAGPSERGSRARAALALALLGLATLAALERPGLARLVFLHLHNGVAIVLWATLFRAHRRWALLPLTLLGLGALALASGLAVRQTLDSPFASSFHLHISTIATWLAPFSSARAALGVTTAYLFLQAVHYSAWLSWIPQQEQPRRATPTYRMSVRALFRDLGAAGVAAVALAAAAVVLGACFDLHRARTLYLSLATFHGYLELAMLAFFWVRGAEQARTPAAVA